MPSSNDQYAERYALFENERTRPARDLIAAIPNQNVARAVDLGCGLGNSTEVLVQKFPKAKVFGIDSAPDMIKTARSRLPHVDFEQNDIAAWNGHGFYDVILANGSLQWVPNHAALLPHLLGKLTAKGCLAVQVP